MTTTAHIFFWTENNRVHPHTLPMRFVDIECEAGLTPWEMIEEARRQGRYLPKGSRRCGVGEIQTDEGIWTRVGTNKAEKTEWSFESWEDIEAREELEDAAA